MRLMRRPRRSHDACAPPTGWPIRWPRRSWRTGASWAPCSWRDGAAADWSEGDRRLLRWAASEVSTAFSRAYALEAAERGAKIDVLTGLPNRRYFDEVLAIERPRRRANDSLGILMIDIDRFKRLNDRYGHATGDRVLTAVAGAIAQGVRAEDTPARYGGEEFAVLLRRASAEQAIEVGERIRREVVKLHPASLGIDEPVTVSVGVAVAGSRARSPSPAWSNAPTMPCTEPSASAATASWLPEHQRG